MTHKVIAKLDVSSKKNKNTKVEEIARLDVRLRKDKNMKVIKLISYDESNNTANKIIFSAILVDETSPLKETVMNIARENKISRYIVIGDGALIDQKSDIKDFSNFKNIYILKYDKDGI